MAGRYGIGLLLTDLYIQYNGNNIYIAPTVTPVNGDPTDATVTGMTGILDCYMAPNNI